MSLRALAIPLALLVLVAGAAVASASPGETTTYLVGFEPGQRDLALQGIRAAGGEVLGTIPAIDTLIVSLPRAAAARLATTAPRGISFVEPDHVTIAAGSQWDGAQWDGAQWNGAQWNGAEWNGAEWNGAQWDGVVDPAIANGWQWGLEAIRGPAAWSTVPGARSATLCVADSGIDASHRDLAASLRATVNTIDNTSSRVDTGGHGTHVAGIAAATHLDSWGVGGVTNSSLLSAKVLSASGTGSASALARGMTWCADNGADVVLLALSVQGSSLAVGRAIDYLALRDVVMVASSGNGGCDDCVSYPAKDPRVIAVAASDRSGATTSFSSKGPRVALRAPGVDILSDLPNASFGYGSGTSQAAAFAAGAATLLVEAKPTITSAEVRAALVGGAIDGRLDVPGALGLVVVVVG